jgi:hypothetical protein
MSLPALEGRVKLGASAPTNGTASANAIVGPPHAMPQLITAAETHLLMVGNIDSFELILNRVLVDRTFLSTKPFATLKNAISRAAVIIISMPSQNVK